LIIQQIRWPLDYIIMRRGSIDYSLYIMNYKSRNLYPLIILAQHGGCGYQNRNQNYFQSLKLGAKCIGIFINYFLVLEELTL